MYDQAKVIFPNVSNLYRSRMNSGHVMNSHYFDYLIVHCVHVYSLCLILFCCSLMFSTAWSIISFFIAVNSFSLDLFCNIPMGWGIIYTLEMNCGSDNRNKTNTYWWCCFALEPKIKSVHNANARLSMVQQARANPNHSRISPKKLAPLTYSNIPPKSRTGLFEKHLNEGHIQCKSKTSYITNVSIFLKAVETVFQFKLYHEGLL